MVEKFFTDEDSGFFKKWLTWPFGNKDANSKKLAEKINDVVIKLREHQDRLNELISQMKRRDKELFDAVVRAQREGDVGRAMVYASEVADLRKIIKVLLTASLVLEKARIRLETISGLAEFGNVALPLVKTFETIRDMIRPVAPQIAIGIDSLVGSINRMVSESNAISSLPIEYTIRLDSEAQQILNEASKKSEEIIESELPRLFPHPPTEVNVQGKVQVKQFKKKLTAEELFDYLRQTNGVLDVSHITSMYDVTKEEVFDLLRELERKGLVYFEV